MNDGPEATPRIAPEVAEALAAGRSVVALESTLIAHGLPWPHNLATAREAEAAVRRAGAVPATIAVLGGRVCVGLDPQELGRLADTAAAGHRARPIKAGRRELAQAVALGLDAATTVSATLHIARSVGVGVMATGGLGGVHRDAARSFDISADLDELARADGMVLVCSGFKSILDIPASVEALETRGVAAIGYQTDHWPAFTTTSSGIPLSPRADGPDAVARIVVAHRRLRLPGAVVVAQAVPGAVAVPTELMDRAIATALADAQAQGRTGQAVTPFLLDRVREATGEASVAANRALIVANAATAGQIATALVGNG
jgi:pseudouridine-5'-phosphate glycosidase